VTTVAVIVVASAFDFWPVSALIRSRRQPAFGLASTILILAASILLYCLSRDWSDSTRFQHLVRVAVSLIYGIFLVQIMMRHQLFAGWRQPLRGRRADRNRGPPGPTDVQPLRNQRVSYLGANRAGRASGLRTGDLGRKRDALASRFR